MNNDCDIRVQWHQPDQHFAAVFLRNDGFGRLLPWFLNGALVGMGSTRGEAVEDLIGIAAYLVVHGENFLTGNNDAVPTGKLPIEDRLWLFELLDGRPLPQACEDEEIDNHAMYMAMVAAGVAR